MTQVMKISNMICATNFHDLCLRQGPRRPRLCRKVGIM